MSEQNNQKRCQLCHRSVNQLTRHHLLPRKYHANKRLKKHFSREEMQQRIIMVCRPCHTHIHTVISEKDMAYTFNTLESLQTHPEVQQFIDWISKKPGGLKPRSLRQGRRK